jgi:regulator of sirC expression with transglutaminase-like and TPR domain
MSTGPHDALDAIGHLPDHEIDIGDAALQLARVNAPDADWQAVRKHLSELARDVYSLDCEDVLSRAAALAGLIHGDHGYRGDTEHYDDLANANLIHVVARRRGLPVALGIIWLHCARAAGWGAHGIDFPGHFLVGLEGRDGQIVLDVFSGGIPLDAHDLRNLLKEFEGNHAELRPGILRPMRVREVLLRLQNNIKVRRLAAGDLPNALTCIADMLRIAPDAASLWREAAMLNLHIEQVTAALQAFKRFLQLVPEGEAADQVRATIKELRSRLN